VSRPRAALLAAATLLVLAAARWNWWPGLRGPAPYPPEWQWGYAPMAVDPGGLVVALGFGAGLVALATRAGRAPETGRRRFAVLAAAVVLGVGWQLALLGLEPSGAWAELERRTESGSFTSYYKVAAGVVDAREFLSRHHELLPRFRHGALHAATHPPGPVLYYLGLQRLAAAASGAADILGGPARAAAIVGALLLGVLGAAACVPVASLARALGVPAAAALRAAVLWALVPGLCLMVPQLDQALALPTAAAAAAVAAALAASKGGGHLARGGAAAGLLAGASAFFSYGAPLLIALGAVAAAAPALRTREGCRRAAIVGAVAIAVTLVCFLLPAVLGHHPLAAARVALAIHREQFTARRSYLLWLLFDPIDLALFLGVPLVLFGLTQPRAGEGTRANLRAFRLAAAGGLALLVASGVIRGEMGRILVPLMPVLLVACVATAPAPGGEAEPSPRTALVLGALLAATDLVLRLSWELP
jgi:hypothetical protein